MNLVKKLSCANLVNKKRRKSSNSTIDTNSVFGTPKLQRGFSFAFSPTSANLPSPDELEQMSPLQRTYTALKLTRGQEDPAITRMKGLIRTATG